MGSVYSPATRVRDLFVCCYCFALSFSFFFLGGEGVPKGVSYIFEYLLSCTTGARMDETDIRGIYNICIHNQGVLRSPIDDCLVAAEIKNCCLPLVLSSIQSHLSKANRPDLTFWLFGARYSMIPAYGFSGSWESLNGPKAGVHLGG